MINQEESFIIRLTIPAVKEGMEVQTFMLHKKDTKT